VTIFSVGADLLFNLQVLRGLAALGVVFYHTDFRLAGDWHTDFSGVAIFFVISGFIMCFITRDNADDFLKMRLIRIVPIYWLCTFALVFLMFRFAVFKPSTWLTAPAWRPEEPFWVYVGRGLLFLPSEQSPALGVGWTLNFEMYFYVVFALALWINRQLAPLIVAAFLIAVFYSDGTICTLFVCHYYSNGYIHYFLAGIALFYIWTFGSFFARGWPVVLMCASGLLYFYGSQFARPLWPDWSVSYVGWFPPFVVACALFMESSGAPITWKPAVLLGDASYSLYLTHTIFFEFARHYLEAWHLPTPRESISLMLFEVVTAILIGIGVHLYVEKPVLRKVRLALRSSRKISEQIVLEPR
jgi:exopolysaccharide production protein ExoZ